MEWKGQSMQMLDESAGLKIERLNAEQASAVLGQLIEQLRDVVDGGAAVGFLPPLSEAEARSYWAGVVAEVERGSRVLLAARQGDDVVGSVQLELSARPNGRHRAEVQKLLVHTRARGQGIARRSHDRSNCCRVIQRWTIIRQ